MIAKPEWFNQRKYSGWGVTPRSWQGWAYTLAIIVPAGDLPGNTESGFPGQDRRNCFLGGICSTGYPAHHGDDEERRAGIQKRSNC